VGRLALEHDAREVHPDSFREAAARELSKLPPSRQRILRVERRARDADEHLAVADARLVDVGDAKDVGWAVAIIDGGLHAHTSRLAAP